MILFLGGMLAGMAGAGLLALCIAEPEPEPKPAAYTLCGYTASVSPCRRATDVQPR